VGPRVTASGRGGYLLLDLSTDVSVLSESEGDVSRSLARIGRSTPFVEAMVESDAGEGLRVDTKSVTLSPGSQIRGVVLRAWTGARWAETASSALDAKALDEAAQQLEGAIRRNPGRAPPPGVASTTKGTWATRPKRSLQELGATGSIALAKEMRGWATGVKGIGEVYVRLDWEEEERLYLNSVGARCHQTTVRTHVAVAPIAIENGRAEYDFWSRGGPGGLELVPELGEPEVRAVAERSCALLKAKAPPTGEIDVVLDPSVAGLLAHESFGHGTEADQFVRERSYLKPLVGQKVGPDSLTIVDDGTVPGGWGSIYCDDEGHPGQRTPLIDHGKFVGALHDRETAAVLGAKPTASTRRSNFMCRAFVRMTNTYVDSGDRSVDEMIRDVRHGVLLEQGSSGIEDPLGGQMQLKVKMGHLIENGQRTDLVGSMALSGRVLDFLRSIRGVSREPVSAMQPGFCGKGHSDYLPVGTGGVHVLSHAIVGPA
jgi:TldD protein